MAICRHESLRGWNTLTGDPPLWDDLIQKATREEGIAMSEQSEKFKQRVEELVARFEAGVDGREWVTRRYPKRMRDDAGQVYEIPALYLQKGPTSLLSDPSATTTGSRGRR